MDFENFPFSVLICNVWVFLHLQEVLNPNRGFVKDDTIIVHARLVYPGPNARPDPTPSSSQSHSTSAHFSQPHHSHSHTPSSLSRSSSSSSSYPGNSRVAQPPIPPLTHPSSQDSMSDSNSQLTPSSTSVLPPEMVSFLSCPYCNEQYEPEGQKSPNTLHCGHSFCLSTCVYTVEPLNMDTSWDRRKCPY